MAERFYVNCPLGPGVVTLDRAEAHHLATVRRLRPGDPVCLFNGDGREYPAVVESATRHAATLEVLAVEARGRELPHRIEVAAPLPKGDRAQFLVEKLTELGVTSFVPLATTRSVVHPGEGKREKLERYVIEASKQCGRNILLRIEPLMGWDAYCRQGGLPETKVVAHPGGAAKDIARSGHAALAFGPEGGFTEEEIATARSAGWHVVDLGPRILRIETAALALAAWAALDL